MKSKEFAVALRVDLRALLDSTASEPQVGVRAAPLATCVHPVRVGESARLQGDEAAYPGREVTATGPATR
jgi:hypothetical protein